MDAHLSDGAAAAHAAAAVGLDADAAVRLRERALHARVPRVAFDHGGRTERARGRSCAADGRVSGVKKRGGSRGVASRESTTDENARARRGDARRRPRRRCARSRRTSRTTGGGGGLLDARARAKWRARGGGADGRDVDASGGSEARRATTVRLLARDLTDDESSVGRRRAIAARVQSARVDRRSSGEQPPSVRRPRTRHRARVLRVRDVSRSRGEGEELSSEGRSRLGREGKGSARARRRRRRRS